ncbi:uncharacterized protein LOC120292499 [Eucalyptus grandis]|uniref:uncharacterized protein LOC120292499 n=1 Tax=Eucalyptus grandis TaxID=71139 RepID=UPI00192ED416|nr:uncharacterized protein LOC120292499 [Eucalyptus grandis]
MVLWNIRKARNGWIFRAKEPKPADLLIIAQEQQISFSRGKPHRHERTLNRQKHAYWTTPEGQDLKLNVDAAWIPGEFLCSVAGVLRDSDGRTLDGFAATGRVSSASEAEAEAILHGLKHMHELQLLHVGNSGSRTGKCFIESDCSPVVEMVMGRAETPWNLKEIVKQCRNGLNQNKNITVIHCPRQANAAADWIARNHRLRTLPGNWMLSPPFLS